MTSLAVVTNEKKVAPEAREQLRVVLTDAGFGGARWYEAPKGSAATPATEKALADGADVVLAVGGDGTVRAVAHALANTSASMAVLPTGTANLFASSLQLPTEPEQVVDLVLHGVVRTFDLGRCNGMRFGVMAGTGYDAALMRAVDDGPKERFGSLAYVWAGVREARRQSPHEVRVVVDGSTFYRGPSVCVLVGNLGHLKAGVVAFPDASPHDGVLEVGVLTASTLRDWAGVAARLAVRKPDSSEKVHLSRGRKIDVTWAPGGSKKQIKAAERTPFELDGGVKGTTRKLKFRCEPDALRVLVPPGP